MAREQWVSLRRRQVEMVEDHSPDLRMYHHRDRNSVWLKDRGSVRLEVPADQTDRRRPVLATADPEPEATAREATAQGEWKPGELDPQVLEWEEWDPE